jgi:hypothetical protein
MLMGDYGYILHFNDLTWPQYTVVARIESWRHAAVLDVPVRCVPRVVITRSG